MPFLGTCRCKARSTAVRASTRPSARRAVPCAGQGAAHVECPTGEHFRGSGVSTQFAALLLPADQPDDLGRRRSESVRGGLHEQRAAELGGGRSISPYSSARECGRLAALGHTVASPPPCGTDPGVLESLVTDSPHSCSRRSIVMLMFANGLARASTKLGRAFTGKARVRLTRGNLYASGPQACWEQGALAA